MRRSRMIWAAALGAVGLVFAVHTAGIGQSPQQAVRSDGTPTGGMPSRPAVTPMAVAEGMLGFASSSAAGGQTVTLVDARRSWMAVYAVDDRGQIRLLSSRPLQEDFSVQFNVTDPTPAEIGRLKPR